MRQTHFITQRGLTLIELLVALALVAIIGATATLFYQPILAVWRLDAGARQIVLDLQRVRFRSIAEGASHRLRFSLQTSSYRSQRLVKRAYEDDGPPSSLPPGVTIEACTARYESVSFQPRGNAGTFGTITLTNGLGQQRLVIVDMVGRTRIQ